jgi:hypothetical protein
VNSGERRQLENKLVAMGFNGVDDPALLEQMADMISHWPGDKHDFLMTALNECDTAKDRKDMYEAIRPKLKFKPLSLQTYEDRIALKAGALISQRTMRVEGDAPKPIEVGERHFIETAPKMATHAIATLKCHKCSKVEKFVADTPVGAMIEGRRAGWVRDPGPNKEMCPTCCAIGILGQEVVQ